MTSLLYSSLLVISVFVTGSFQLPGDRACEISHGINGGLNGSLTAVDNCTTGDISWHYPTGMLSVSFPRTILPDLAQRRKKMRVCFQGGIGNGVSSITQKLTRRNRIATHRMKLVDSRTEWVCSRPSRHPQGIVVTLHSEGKARFYLKTIHYKAEVVKPKSGRGKKGNRGNNMRGKNRDRIRPKGRGDRRGNKNRNRNGEARGNRKDYRRSTTTPAIIGQ